MSTYLVCSVTATDAEPPKAKELFVMSKEVKLTQGMTALIDDDDFERVNKIKWQVMKSRVGYYAQSAGKNKTVLMHRFIMKTPKNMVCDHINHNTLDNRKSNLRNCTRSQNQMNRKTAKNKLGLKGVDYHAQNGKYRAQIQLFGKKIHIGYFDTKEEATEAYKNRATELFGEFANV